MLTKTTKNLGGRPPLPPEERKSYTYGFRVAPWERELLESQGDTDFWRAFCVTVASVLKNKGYGYGNNVFTLEILGKLAEEISEIYKKEE